MATFDFISGEDFRASLEADYHELNLSLKSGAWKAAHVLAGSIIEAVLIDYLTAINYHKPGTPEPLNMSLAQAISACRSEDIISQKAADLSSVIRQYRNLIHPGRALRLGEAADENEAKIAEALIHIIIEEISARKQKTYGYTAEQIITKIERDSSAMVIMGDLMKRASQLELERLLLKVIPNRYFELLLEEQDPSDTLSSLAVGFRLAFSLASDEIKSRAMRNFVVILKEESGRKVLTYEEAFFKGSNLLYLPVEDALLVKKHLLARLKRDIYALREAIEGIGPFLTSDEVNDFVDPLVQEMNTEFGFREHAEIILRNEIANMQGEVLKTSLERLDSWIRSYKRRGDSDSAERIEAINHYLTYESGPEDIPF